MGRPAVNQRCEDREAA